MMTSNLKKTNKNIISEQKTVIRKRKKEVSVIVRYLSENTEKQGASLELKENNIVKLKEREREKEWKKRS